MAQIYGELIRAQLQVSASDLASPAAGLVYFNSTTGAKWYNGSAWKTAVDLDSSQTLANKSLDATCSINSGILPVVPLTKGGLGADASAWSGLVKISGGVASASSLALTDIPDTLITYAKLNLADGDIPQAKVSGLVTDLAGKLTGNAAITGATKTKITYDSKGLVTAGADLAAGDLPTGIDATKIADGSVDNTEFQKLGTAGTSGAGLLVTTDGLQSLSSKTLVEPVLDNFIDINEEAAPAAPGAGKLRVYAKSDSKIYKKDSTGTESEIGAGGSGTGRNYLQDWFDGTKPIGTIINGLTSTGNRSTSGGANLQWGASNTSNMTLTLETVTPLRQTSSIKIDSLNTTSGAFVETPMFLIDNADLGKPLSVEFDIGDIAANTNYDIVVMQYNLSGTYQQTIPVAGNASTGTPSSAQLPTGTTKFRGFFITSGDAGGYYYSLRIRKLAAVDDDFQIDSLFVGPQSLAQGAVVTAWQAYTPVFSGVTATGSVYYRRVGDSIEVEGLVDCTAVLATTFKIGLPTGLTIDSTKVSGNNKNILGSIVSSNGGGSAGVFTSGLSGLILQDSSDLSAVFVATLNAADATGNVTSTNVTGSGYLNPTGQATFRFTAPISQWSSGTTTLADRAVEEYVFNTSTSTTTSDTTSFGYGPQGAQIQNIANFLQRRVQFQTNILPTDKLFVEISSDRVTWIPAGGLLNGQVIDSFRYDGSNFCGIGFGTTTEANKIDIYFGALRTTTGTWAGVVGTYYWRARKISSGAAVGFPVSARNIVGDTSGTAVPSGYVGEVVKGNNSTLTNFPISGNFGDATSFSLTPGRWSISVQILTDRNGATMGGEYFIGISTTPGNSSTGLVSGENLMSFDPGPSSIQRVSITISCHIVDASTTTQYYLKVRADTSSGTPQYRYSYKAIRIA